MFDNAAEFHHAYRNSADSRVLNLREKMVLWKQFQDWERGTTLFVAFRVGTSRKLRVMPPLEYLADSQCQYPAQGIEKSGFERRGRSPIGIMHRLPTIE